MFTGLVERLAPVVAWREEGAGARLTLAWPNATAEIRLGESIALNGCCLTVVRVGSDDVAFQLGPETLARTNLADARPGESVNVERSLRVGDSLGGHFVTGHVDGPGTVAERVDEGEWTRMRFAAADELTRQMAPRGSVAVDGVSLTLVDVEQDGFSVMLIPHTLAITTLGKRKVGDRVNLETDLLAKYVMKVAR